MNDAFINQFTAFLSSRLSNAGYSHHEDHTSSGTFGKKGKEFFVSGTTGVAALDVTATGTGFDVTLVANVSIPFSGKYTEKNFIGVGGEHPNDDNKDPKGIVKFKVTKTFLNQVIEGLTTTGTNIAADHSSITMSVQGVVDDVISHIKS